MNPVNSSRFSLRGNLMLTAVVAVAFFLFREGYRIDSRLSGYGLVIGTLVLFGLTLYLGLRFSTKPSATRMTIYATLIILAILLGLIEGCPACC